MPMSTASPTAMYRPLPQTTHNTQMPLLILVPRPTPMGAPMGAPMARIQPGKKEHSYADVAALMVTKPGGQVWQEVLLKQKNRATKEATTKWPQDLKPAKEKD